MTEWALTIVGAVTGFMGIGGYNRRRWGEWCLGAAMVCIVLARVAHERGWP